MARVPLGKPLEISTLKLEALSILHSKPSELDTSLLIEKWNRIAKAPLGVNKSVLPKYILREEEL